MADEAQQTTEPPKSSKKLIIVGLLSFLVISVVGAGAAYYLGVKSASGDVADDGTVAAPALPSEALYVALDPAFTVNFNDDGNSRFLQLSLEAMTRDAGVVASIEQNTPMIRNNLVLLFSSKSSEQLESRQGKEQLREETRAVIQEAVKREGADGDVEAVFFTSFVMQ